MRLSQFALCAITVFTLPVGPTPINQSKRVPNVDLEFTVQQKSDGKLAEGYHVHHLLCADTQCQLTILTLNQCGGEKRFYPKIETFATQDGDLEVRIVSQVLEVKVRIVDIFGTSDSTFRIGFAKEYPNQKFASRITTFSGAVVKNSHLLKKLISWEWEPLRGEGTLKDVALSCKASLPSIANH